MAGLKPIIKTAIEGVVDEIDQDALRVESNSAHFAVVRRVNTGSVKVTNRAFNGQGRTKEQRRKSSGKTSTRRATDPCFRCGAVGHCKNEWIMIMATTAPAAFRGDASICIFVKTTAPNKQQQQIAVYGLSSIEWFIEMTVSL